VVKPKEDEKKLLVQLSLKIEQFSPKNAREVHDGPHEEEGLESLEEERETQPKTLRRSTY